jgi:tetratricopeptide (TPR) repeat protein
VVLASLLVASPVLGQPNQPSEKDQQVAGELVKKAIARSQAGDHSAAIDIYLQAYTIVPNSILLSNIGTEFQQSGKQREALRYFCMYLEKDPTGTNAPYATSQARKMHALLGNKGVEDEELCPPAPTRVKPPPPPPPETEVPHGDTTTRYVAIGAGVTGVVALGISAYAGYQGKTISDKISRQPLGEHWPDNIRSLQKSGENYNVLAITTVVGGGVLVATGAILYLMSRSSSSEPAHDKPTVAVTPTTSGFAVFGTF